MLEKDIVGVKDNILTRVARAVTERDVTVYYGRTSHTNGSSIYVDYNEDSLGILALLYHEIQHVIHTPQFLFSELHNSSDLRKDVLNVVEDVRIESLTPTMYVAALLQYNNVKSVLQIFQRSNTILADPVKAVLACIITHGFLGLNYEDVLFAPQYAEKVRKAYGLIDKIRGEEDPHATVETADEIVKLLNNMFAEQQNQNTQPGKGNKQTKEEADKEQNGEKSSKGKEDNKTNAIRADVVTSLRRVRKELRTKKSQIEANVINKTEKDVNLSQVKTTDKTVINALLHNNNNEKYQKEILLSNLLAEETYNKIKALSTIRDEIAYSGKFDQKLWVKNRASSPVWFKKRSESKELLRRKVALLIDASGSMMGDNAVHAFIAARVFWIVMSKLHIPFSVLYYSVASYPVAQIDHLTPLDIGGTRPKNAVEEVPKEDKLIVVSDGIFRTPDICPEGWNKDALSVRLWGVGIGEDITFPEVFFKGRVRIAEKPRKLPGVIAETLISILLK